MSTHALTEQVLRQARERGDESLLLHTPAVVAISGGTDSLALLDILLELRGERARDTLHVVHINHGLRGDEAEADARFVSEFAASRELRCVVETVDTRGEAEQRGLSLEDAARRLRYGVLGRIAAAEGSAIFTAHTAHDQAETVLMNLLRGSGLTGLGGMRVLSVLDPALSGGNKQVALYRPLLHRWRDEIEAYCQVRGLEPRRDSSNGDIKFRRNRIRHELLPLLERDYSAAIKDHLVRLAEVAGDENALLDAMAMEDATRLADVTPGGEIVFQRERFETVPVAMQRRVIRLLLFQAAGTLTDISFEAIERVRGIAGGRGDSPRAIDLPHGLRVRRGDGYVVIGRQAAVASSSASDSRWPILRPGDLLRIGPGCKRGLEGGWSVECLCLPYDHASTVPGELVALFDWDVLQQSGPLALRTRRPGDFIRPLGISGRKSLHDLFIDAKIPRGTRDGVALFAADAESDEVLWVPGPGGRRSARAALGESTLNILAVQFSRSGVE